MVNLQSIERANTQGQMWPTIADAVDTMVRRRVSTGDAYERIWRAIHVWEAISTTLAAAAFSRLATSPQRPEDAWRRAREHWYGARWDPVTEQVQSEQAAADGSAAKRIDIVAEVARTDLGDQPFVAALRTFLTSRAPDLTAFSKAWARACEVPREIVGQADALDMHKLLIHLNTFRNRFAHVPFPYDPLEEIADALELVTDEAMRITLFERDAPHVFAGAFARRGTILVGTSTRASTHVESDDPSFVFTPKGVNVAKDIESCETWPSQGFLFIDGMARPYLLTRLRDQSAEYTRFKAEANAVVQRNSELFDVKVANLSEADYKTVSAEPPDSPPEQATSEVNGDDYGDAIQALREDRFVDAIDVLSRITERKPTYHVAWLKFGHAQRELAVRLRSDNPTESVHLLRQALESLTHATKHRDSDYQAEAFYERSKVHFWLELTDPGGGDWTKSAVADATQACTLSSRDRYWTWLERLEETAISSAKPGS